MNNEQNARLTASESNIKEAFARLSMLEFAFEIIISNNLSKASPEFSQIWKTEFVRMMKNPKLPDSFTHDSEQLEADITERAVQMAERFVQKVAAREALMRSSPGHV